MALKIPAVQELREDILLKGRDGTAVKAHTLIENRQQRPGQHHVSDPEGRRHGTGKSVQIDHVPVRRTGKKRLFRLAKQGEF